MADWHDDVTGIVLNGKAVNIGDTVCITDHRSLAGVLGVLRQLDWDDQDGEFWYVELLADHPASGYKAGHFIWVASVEPVQIDPPVPQFDSTEEAEAWLKEQASK